MKAAEFSSTSNTWAGTSMSDIYYGHGPWGFDSPPLSPSKDHAVLYQIPATLQSPPKPHFSQQVYHWDNDHVRMPFSPKNLFPIKDENGEAALKERWSIIETALLQPIKSSKELEKAITSYNSKLPKFFALHHFFEEVLDDNESQLFFESVLPGIIRLALQLPEILPGSLPLLKQETCKSVSLSQLQIASLLANAFLCTFPWRKDCVSYPGVNFVRLFSAHYRPKRVNAVAEKFKCVCHYFRRVLNKTPVGVITFTRNYISKSQFPRWDYLKNNLGNVKIHVSSTGTIEDDGLGLLQVDFANKNVGGGVLGFGCVQEEIRYIICPELIVSRLFTEQLGPYEALTVIGVERFSSYRGYGDSFEWAGNYQDETPHDKYGRRKTSIVAIDATRFNKPADQYNPSLMLRELNKAYSGFYYRSESHLPAVATGNWGCGAYRGDPYLKSLLQLMACSAARRHMVYFTFGDPELRNSIHTMHTFLANNQITISQLWSYLCQFIKAGLKFEHLFSFIYQSHMDTRNKLSTKGAISPNKKVVDKGSIVASSSKVFSSNIEIYDTLTEKMEVDSVSESQEFDDDLDVIPSSQPDFQSDVSHEKKEITKNALDQELQSGNPTRIENHSDIVDIINIIDGNNKYNNKLLNENDSHLSFLSYIDKVNDKVVDTEENITKNEEKTTTEEFAQNITEQKEQSVGNNVLIKASSSNIKNKITDYFSKSEK